MTNDVFTGLDPAIAAKMRATVERREKAGTNVHFLRDDGTPDRFSFCNEERAEAFRAKLRRLGLKIINEAN